MKITDARIRYFKKGGLRSVRNEGLRHIKALPCLSIVQATEGSYDIALGGGEFSSTGEGGFFVAPSDIQQTIIHRVNKTSGKMSARWIFVDMEINGLCKLESLFELPVTLSAEKAARLNKVFDRIFSSDGVLENYSDCYLAAAIITEGCERKRKEPPQRIRDALLYIKNNYAKEITVAALAELSHTSESNFYAAFKHAVGDSPISYLNSYRLSVAASKLSDTELSVSEICASVGIGDPLYFSKLFKRVYGMSPREYRKAYTLN